MPTQEETAELLSAKIHGEFAYATKHFHEALKKEHAEVEQAKTTEVSVADNLISEILKEEKEQRATGKVASLLKFEKNLGD